MNRLRTVVLLSAPDRRLLVGAAVLLLLGSLLRVVSDVRTLQRSLEVCAALFVPTAWEECNDPNQIGRAVAVADAQVPGRRSCLVRALTGRALLDAVGLRGQLRIGVAKDANGDLEAHAWVESHDQVIVGGHADISRYQILSKTDADAEPL